MNSEDKIRSMENYFRLRELFKQFKSGTSGFFTQKMKISRRTFYRYVKYMITEDGMKITYDKKNRVYWLEEE